MLSVCNLNLDMKIRLRFETNVRRGFTTNHDMHWEQNSQPRPGASNSPQGSRSIHVESGVDHDKFPPPPPELDIAAPLHYFGIPTSDLM